MSIESTSPVLRDVTFHNVTITIHAPDGPSAYSDLCRVLGTLASDWITDTYTIFDEDGREIEEGTTDALWPTEADADEHRGPTVTTAP